MSLTPDGRVTWRLVWGSWASRKAAQCEVRLTWSIYTPARLWEIVLKNQAGKLKLPATSEFQAHLRHLGVRDLLAIQPAHIYALLRLPVFHGDSFDRLLTRRQRACTKEWFRVRVGGSQLGALRLG